MRALSWLLVTIGLVYSWSPAEAQLLGNAHTLEQYKETKAAASPKTEKLGRAKIAKKETVKKVFLAKNENASRRNAEDSLEIKGDQEQAAAVAAEEVKSTDAIYEDAERNDQRAARHVGPTSRRVDEIADDALPASKLKIMKKAAPTTESVLANEPKVNDKQASQDYLRARETLKEVREESRAKKVHVKTKEEIREEREMEADRKAILKAQTELAKHGGKKKSQYVKTSKGVVKVVFIDENDFAKDKPAAGEVDPKVQAALKDVDRGPSSVDQQLENVE